MAPPAEDLSVTARHDTYPGIDPVQHYKAQTYKDKVALITGASSGIGEEIAFQYARAGASIVLLARRQALLEEVQSAIKKELPHTQVLIFAVDVVDTKQVEAAVKSTIERFGKIDIVIANAGKAAAFDKSFAEKDPDEWWSQIEVNVRGVYNLVHFAVPYLVQSKGYVVIVSSAMAQMRMPFSSAYATSKHALNRLAEFIVLEYPEVKVFSIHPGIIMTDMAKVTGFPVEYVVDTLQLPASTILRLTSGKDDYLSGRYVSASWDLDEVALSKDRIVEADALKNRLALPL